MMKVKFVYFVGIIILSLNAACSLLIPGFKQLEEATIFNISSNQKAIILNGTINSSAFDKFTTLSSKYPQAKTIEIVNCDGSINDEVNLKLAKYIHAKGFDTYLRDNGLVASGGTDLFLAGRKRTKGKNTKIGVHSWSGLLKTATDFPKGHKNHLPYIKYYQAIGMTKKKAEEFYYFTINSAPADTMHWMTKQEIVKYNILNP